MLRSSLIVALVFVGLTACGKLDPKNQVSELNKDNFPNVTGALYGKWHSINSTTDAQGVPHTLNLYFNSQQQMGYEQVCGTLGSSVAVSMAVPATYSGNQIQVTNTQHLTQKTLAGTDCNLDIEPATFDFQVNGNQLVLTDGVTYSTFQRILP